MFKDETVRQLAREKRVKLFENMMIKGAAEISFIGGEDDLFKKIRGTFSESYGQDYTYCEIDFKAGSSDPISFPDSFECIITDNIETKVKVESLLGSMNGKPKPHVYVSSFPSYSGP